MAGRVWRAFPPFFTYPLKDRPGKTVGPFNSISVNPDNRIDLYLIVYTFQWELRPMTGAPPTN